MLLVPPRGTRVKAFKLPLWLAAASGLAISALLLVTVITCIRAVQLQGEMVDLTRLRQVNAEQGTQLRSLQQEADQDRATLQEINSLEQRVQASVGLGSRGQASRSEPAGGGALQRALLSGTLFNPVPSVSAVTVDLHTVTQDAATTEQTLELLQQQMDARIQASNAMPDHWPVSGPISSPFGVRLNPFTGEGSEFHTGIDIAVPYGTPVEAAGAGAVIFVGYKSGYGMVVTIDHGNGYQSSYCHLSAVLTAVGKRVNKGDVIGRVGTNGRSTGPHLHFGMTLNGVLVNPQPLLK
jgi:murein DD-endopeptidase MepM/ murein hydrolase activator NlpD